MARRWLVFVLVWLVPCSAYAERLPVERFTTADGLGDNAVHRIVRDSRGYLWFCTREGLSRFDGHVFVTYGVEHGLPSAVVYDFIETRKGELWVATRGGLVHFDPQGEPTAAAAADPQRRAMFTTYITGRQSPASAVAALLEDRSGVLWVATFSGLFRLETTDGTRRLKSVDLGIPRNLDGRVYALLQDATGALWIGTATGLYRRPPGGGAERQWPGIGGAPGPVHSLLQDRSGDLWVGTRNDGMVRITLEPTTGRPVARRVYTAADGLPSHWINGLFEASDGGLWAGSAGGLVQLIARADGADYHVRTYAVAQGLPNHEITTIAEDRAGNLWVGALAGGAARIAAAGFTIFDAGDGLAWANTLLAERNGDLVIVGGRSFNEWALIRYVDGSLAATVLPVMDRRAWGWNQTVLTDRTGDWWLATAQGVVRYSGVATVADLARASTRYIYTMRDGLPNDVVLRLFEDSRGDVWISTTGHGERANGLTRWRRATGALETVTDRDGVPSLENYFVSSFAEDRAGHVWIGFSGDGGLVRYHDGAFTRFGTEHGIPPGPVRNLLVDSRGRIWVANIHGGLVRCDEPDADSPRFALYTTAEGLSSNGVHAVVEDGRGLIWVATARGIDRLDPATGSVSRVSTVVGLEGGEFAAAFADRHGTLWFSRGTSLVRLVPRDVPPPAPPNTLITGARIAGDDVPISALGQALIERVMLTAGDNQVDIEFVAPGSGPGAALLYQTWLEGANAGWGEPSDHRSVRYASLSPGAYRFHVRALNAEGTPGEAAAFAFTILPPVWQRWWFLILVGLAVTWVAAALYRYRVSRLLEVANLRTRIATDLHDDIGANLTRIALLSEVARQRGGAGGQVDRGLLAIADLARESVASLGEIVWAINPERDRLLDLERRMREYAEDLLALGNIELHFEAPDSAGTQRIPLDVRRELFLVFKEAIRNAARHSGCRRIDVELRATGAALGLEIRDDGKGFDPDGDTEGNGLLSMRRRADGLHAKLEVITAPGTGTTVRFVVPLGRRPGHRGTDATPPPTHRSR